MGSWSRCQLSSVCVLGKYFSSDFPAPWLYRFRVHSSFSHLAKHLARIPSLNIDPFQTTGHKYLYRSLSPDTSNLFFFSVELAVQLPAGQIRRPPATSLKSLSRPPPAPPILPLSAHQTPRPRITPSGNVIPQLLVIVERSHELARRHDSPLLYHLLDVMPVLVNLVDFGSSMPSTLFASSAITSPRRCKTERAGSREHAQDNNTMRESASAVPKRQGR